MSQLAWPQILSVALHLRVCEEVVLREHSWDTYMSDEHSLALLSEFRKIAAAELQTAGRIYRTPADAAEEGPAIDAYLARVGHALLVSAKHLAENSTHAKRLLEAIVTACGSAMCYLCSGPRACTWTRRSGADDEQRMAAGKCMQPVRELFSWVCDAVALRYRQAGVHQKVTAPQLVMGHGVQNTDLELAINASTHRGSARGSREVRMTFNPENLSVPDYLSLAYVFVHECTNHVWCGVDIEAPAAASSTPFHDGWMDAVAAAILRSALRNHSLAPPPHAEEIWSQTIEVRGRRLSKLRPSPSADVDHWRDGVRAFDTARFLFAQTLGGELEPFDPLWQRVSTAAEQAVVDLSLRINASKISHYQRARFVQAILQHFARSSDRARAKALTRQIQVIDFVEEYIQCQDVKKLVGQVDALPR